MWRREGEKAHYIDGASKPYNRRHEARPVMVVREWRELGLLPQSLQLHPWFEVMD